MNSVRKYNYDNLKGILIFLVVLGHLLYSNEYNNIVGNILLRLIYSFHMPVFMIISGHFSKKTNKDNFYKYIFLFIMLNISFVIFDYITNNSFNLLELKYSSWYLLLILIYRAILKNKKVKSIIKNNKKIILCLSFIIGTLITIFKLPLILIRLFMYFFFFIFGLLYNDKIGNNKYIDFISLILLFVILLSINIITVLPISFYLGETQYLVLLPIRIILNILSVLIFILMVNIIPNKKILFISKWGRYSLYIYILHRIPTLLLCNIISSKYYIFISIIICIILSSKYIVKVVDYILNAYMNNKKTINIIMLIIIILLSLFDLYYNNKLIIRKEISPKEQNRINNSISIGFVGDLILLEDQIKNSKVGNNYNFDYMFNYTKKYFKTTDYTIGVFEGVSDDTKEYSIGNYDDGKEMHLNYPSSFIKSIKKSGIDLVTTSNNHVYDKDYNSILETINNLHKYNLDYVGYTTDKSNIRIINIKGIKIGIASYTYGTNYKSNKEAVKYIVDQKNRKYKTIKNNIEKEIKELDKKCDLVIILPHYGTEFNYGFDNFQKHWNRIFINSGADIIFGDHSHVIGPINYRNNKYILSSPGNYTNSYIKHNGDISMYTKVYVDKKSKRIINSSIIPLISIKKDKGYFPMSLYDASKIKNNRVKYAKELFGKTVMNNKNILLKEEYFYKNNKYKYPNKYNLKITNKNKKSLLYKKISNNKNICFIGDSITAGTINNSAPWYKYLMNEFKNKKVINISHDSYMSEDILKYFSNRIKESNCNLYIINIGTNDIRYKQLNISKYIKNINKIIKLTNNNNVILLSPWRTYSQDKKMIQNRKEKDKLYTEYSKELNKIAIKNKNIYYINPNSYIKKAIDYNDEEDYLLDGVHPNDIGVKLYSISVLQ